MTASRRARKHAGRRIRVTTVVGELLVTVSVVLLLFVGWEVWWNPLVAAGQQAGSAGEQSRQWIDDALQQPIPVRTPSADTADPPVMKPVAAAQPFAVLFVPRFGEEWKRVIKETVGQNVLNDMASGVGHYPDTAMPGAVGNFAIAGHDTGWGNAFIDIFHLRIGDKIIVQTKDGWYTYLFRNFEYVQPDAVDVLWAEPRHQQESMGDRLLTITTCNPPWHSQERIIAYAVFDSWQPLTAGAPAEIAAAVADR